MRTRAHMEETPPNKKEKAYTRAYIMLARVLEVKVKNQNLVKKTDKTFADVKVLLKTRKPSDFIVNPIITSEAKGDK